MIPSFRSLRVVPALLLAALAAPAVDAQLCPGGGDNFWKADNIPQVPVGPLGASVIQGLCEGEALGKVFTLPPGMPVQKITSVGVGFGHGSGAGGFNATCNIEIYDGLTWNGNLPVLGTKVFDLGDDLAAELQVISHGINTFDFSTQVPVDVEVGNTANRRFVVVFRSAINPNGSCAGGHPANYMTDYTGGGGCQSTPQTNLMDIEGQGWRDVNHAQVLGFNICGGIINAYNGNWLIRACTTDAAPSNNGQFINLGNQLTGNFAPVLTGNGSLVGGETFDLSFTGMPPSQTLWLFVGISRIDFFPFFGGTLVPNPDFTFLLPTSLGALFLPGQSLPPGIPPGFSIYLHGWMNDPGGPAGAAATNALELITP